MPRKPVKKSATPRFSRASLEFLLKAGRQRHPRWLERRRAEQEALLLAPLRHLAARLKSELAPQAVGYHFPQKGIGRLRRPAGNSDGALYKDWLTYSAARPRVSRFTHNPNLYFLINPDDRDDHVLVAGGLYMPSSQQMRAIREAIAENGAVARDLDRLFASRPFARRFPGGFSRDKLAKRLPKDFDPRHPRMDWIRLQGFFVWRSYKLREFTSADFPRIVAEDWRQILRMNEILENILSGRREPATRPGLSTNLLDRLGEVENSRRELDF